MPIVKTARFEVGPEGIEQTENAIAEFVRYIQNNEPGTRLYSALRAKDGTNSYLHVMMFEDETAEDVHRNSDAVKAFTEILHPVTVDGLNFTDYDLIASTL